MAKKKKKLEAALTSGLNPYLPGAMPTTTTRTLNFAEMLWNLRNYAQVIEYALEPTRTKIDTFTRDPQTTMGRAWFEYTGIPTVVVGGLGALGFQAIAQSPQAYAGWRAGVYSSLLVAYAMEVLIGTVVTATVLTITDPAHKYPGGTDELMRGVVHPTTSKDIIMGLGSWGAVV